jgi:hypothetical protein
MRESREMVLARIENEMTQAEINDYLRLIALGGESD